MEGRTDIKGIWELDLPSESKFIIINVLIMIIIISVLDLLIANMSS